MAVVQQKRFGEQPFHRAQHNLVAAGVDVNHIQWLRRRDAKPPALTDSEVPVPLMCTKYLACFIHEVSRAWRHLHQLAFVAAVEVLALWFVLDGEAKTGGEPAYVGLAQLTKRKEDT